MKRRTFLSNLATCGLAMPILRSYANETLKNDNQPVRIVWITDVHHGYGTDAQQRLKKFMTFSDRVKPNFILQGANFCHPTPEAASFIQVWNSFAGKKIHVLGNHDMNKGSKSAIMDLWQMQQPYYSFDAGAFHFVVLDCIFSLKDDRYVDCANANYYINAQYRDLVSPEQIAWLEHDLKQTSKPTIIISHQAFGEIWTGGTVPNRMLVR
jgi:hypothetical protein